MGKLIQRLQDASRSGVYRAPRAADIVAALRGSKLALASVRFGEKDRLLADLAAALEFPAWFGRNWDALEDCLGDLSWSDAAGHVLIVEEPRPGDELGIFIDVLRSSAQHRAARGRPFFAVFIDPAGALSLPLLYRAK
jgi:hypothetical protein